MKEKINQLLASKDIEMVRLGAILLRRMPRNMWFPTLKKYEGDWYFTICNNKIEIKNDEEWKWEIPGRNVKQQSIIQSVGGTLQSGYPLSSYQMVYMNFQPSRDFDEEKKKKRDLKAEKLRRESIKYKRK